MNRLSRRGILGGAAALVPAVGVGASLPPAEPDAALVAACARHVEAERVFSATLMHEPDDDDPRRPAWEVEEARVSAIRSDRVEEVLDAPCTTLAGVLALTRALVACKPEVLTATGYDDEDLAAKLLSVLLAMGGTA